MEIISKTHLSQALSGSLVTRSKKLKDRKKVTDIYLDKISSIWATLHIKTDRKKVFNIRVICIYKCSDKENITEHFLHDVIEK